MRCTKVPNRPKTTQICLRYVFPKCTNSVLSQEDTPRHFESEYAWTILLIYIVGEKLGVTGVRREETVWYKNRVCQSAYGLNRNRVGDQWGQKSPLVYTDFRGTTLEVH